MAYGATEYVDMARSLALSLQRSSPGIPRALVTDSEDEDLPGLYDHVIPLHAEWGNGVSQKLHIDLYSPWTQTLFIDSDSLVFGSLEFAFEAFAGTGACIAKSNFVDASTGLDGIDFSILNRDLGVSRIPRFNGGIYFIEKRTKSEETIQLARSYLPKYRALGFGEFRGAGPPDELLIGTAMAVLGIPFSNPPRIIMRTPIGLQGKLKVDVSSGRASFDKAGQVVEPAIVHFAGGWRNHPTYLRESTKLRILESSIHGSEFRARVFSFFFDIRIGCKILVIAMWERLPKKVRWNLRAVYKRIIRPC